MQARVSGTRLVRADGRRAADRQRRSGAAGAAPGGEREPALARRTRAQHRASTAGKAGAALTHMRAREGEATPAADGRRSQRCMVICWHGRAAERGRIATAQPWARGRGWSRPQQPAPDQQDSRPADGLAGCQQRIPPSGEGDLDQAWARRHPHPLVHQRAAGGPVPPNTGAATGRLLKRGPGHLSFR